MLGVHRLLEGYSRMVIGLRLEEDLVLREGLSKAPSEAPVLVKVFGLEEVAGSGEYFLWAIG